MRCFALSAMCILALTFSAAAATAAAATPIRVVYLPLALLPDDLTAENIDEAFHAELSEQASLLVVAPTSRRDKAEGLVVRKEASWLLQARAELDKGHIDKAITALKKGITSTEKKPEAVPVSTITEARLLLSVAEFRRGADDEGQKSLEEFARLRPQAKLVAKDYPPLFVRLLEQAKARWQKKSNGELDIDADAPGTVELDGTLLGAPPLQVERVPPGMHFLAFVSGEKQAVKRIEVGGTAQSIHFAVAARGGHALSKNIFAHASKTALGQLARDEGAAYVVSGVVVAMHGTHNVAMVVVNGSGEGQVAGSVTLDGDPSGWAGEVNKVIAKLVTLTTHGVKDEDANPLLVGAASGAESLCDLDMFPADRAPPKPEKVAEKPEAPKGQRPLKVKPIEPLAPEPKYEQAPQTVSPDSGSRTPVEQTTAPVVKTPLYQQWWLWTIVGAVVAGGVITAVVVSTAKVNQVSIHASW